MRPNLETLELHLRLRGGPGVLGTCGPGLDSSTFTRLLCELGEVTSPL